MVHVTLVWGCDFWFKGQRSRSHGQKVGALSGRGLGYLRNSHHCLLVACL